MTVSLPNQRATVSSKWLNKIVIINGGTAGQVGSKGTVVHTAIKKVQVKLHKDDTIVWKFVGSLALSKEQDVSDSTFGNENTSPNCIAQKKPNSSTVVINNVPVEFLSFMAQGIPLDSRDEVILSFQKFLPRGTIKNVHYLAGRHSFVLKLDSVDTAHHLFCHPPVIHEQQCRVQEYEGTLMSDDFAPSKERTINRTNFNKYPLEKQPVNPSAIPRGTSLFDRLNSKW